MCGYAGRVHYYGNEVDYHGNHAPVHLVLTRAHPAIKSYTEELLSAKNR